jgi:hypothetical protein
MAYLKVASKRFSDDVPMNITSCLLDRLPETLAAKLLEELLESGDQIDELMHEDPVLTRRRQALKARSQCLARVRSQLLRLRT